MIRLGSPYDIASMKKLWDECFNDNVNYIDFIFDKVSKPSDAMVCELDGKVVAMLLMIPTRFVWKNEVINSLYIFGACTTKKYRGKGIMTQLLKQAELRAQNSGAGISLLVPGDRFLFDYYEERGYSETLFHRRIVLDKMDFSSVDSVQDGLVVDLVSPKEVFSIRFASLRNYPHIAWSERQMEFVIDDTQIYGGHCATFNGTSGKAVAFYNTYRKKVYVNECVGTSDRTILEMLKTIMEREGARQLTVDLPMFSTLFDGEGTKVPYGLAKPISVKGSFEDINTYMGMMLD